MWFYRSAENSAQPVVLFDYQPGRGHEHPARFLDGFAGILMTDGYAAWRMLRGFAHRSCMAHARRKFHDAFKAQKKAAGRVSQALKLIGQLDRIERDIRPCAIGRKNWLLSDLVAGARAGAIIYSIMLTCRSWHVEPYRYLCHVLNELPKRGVDADVSDLLPFHFNLDEAYCAF